MKNNTLHTLRAQKTLHSLKTTLVLLLTLVMIGGTGWFAPLPAASSQGQAQSVILLIGDGMGLAHIQATEMYAQEVLGRSLAMTTLNTHAITTTHSANTPITDSAAAGTAIHSGFKVKNSSINVLPDGTWAYTIGQAAQRAGKSVGIVSTARLTHATPASVYGHVANRSDENLLAEQMLEFAPQVALGGGTRYFIPTEANGRREDGRHLIDEMAAAGYTNVTNARELLAVDPAATDRLLGVFARSHMAFEIDRVNTASEEPSLAEMTAVTLDILDNNPAGFFAMIEGARIDYGAHFHDIAGLIHETLAFDAAVQVALDYQAQHPEVLVIVTADHETGGLVLAHDAATTSFTRLAHVTCSQTTLHAQIRGNPENALALAEQCGLVLNEDQAAWLATFPANTPEIEGVDSAFVLSWGHFVFSQVEADMTGVHFGTWGHTAVPVITFAIGPGAEQFAGFIDNTDLAHFMAEALGVTLPAPAPAG